jgi:Flp pilus assembly protein TadG
MHVSLHRPELKRLRAAARDDSGVALVEFALILPILAVMLFGMLDFGKAYNYWIDETQLAHEGARYAAVSQNPDPTNYPGDFLAALRNQADTAELRDGGTTSVPNPLTVCVYLPDGAQVGKPVTVEVRSSYKFLSFITSQVGVTEGPIVARSTMRLERVPTFANGDCA